MLKLNNGTNAQGADVPTHEKTGLFFPQFVPVPGPLAGQMQLMLVPGSGIPMRDYFAAQAMQGLVADLDYINPDHATNSGAIARDAYAMADAMIEARKPATVERKDFPYTDGDHKGFPYADGDL